ncbi:MAG: ABC transporter permease [Tepidisphaeraceae bacterium]
MYKLLLILKYLRKRRIAWVSLVAVMLCTAMVLVVISVMGGWLDMFKAKFRGMSGDIVVYRKGLSGFGGYEQMLAEIKKLPEVDEALPLIRTFGLININNQIIEGVQVTGLDIAQFSKFNKFRQSLWRQYQQPLDQGKQPPAVASFDLLPNIPYAEIRPNDPRAAKRPGIIVGGPLVGMTKGPDGKVIEPPGLYDAWCRLEVVPISSDFTSLKDTTPAANIYWIVDASRTQLYQLDANSVYVPFDVVQKDLQMTAQTYTEVRDGKQVQRVQPARCSEIQINLKPGYDRAAVLPKINAIVQSISTAVEPFANYPVNVEPWEQQQAKFLGAVEKEKSLVTFLFAMISLVAIFLIFCILYMIVVEKTKDIGIIKSVGATSSGVAAIFLGYGLAIGVVGGGLGLGVAAVIITYINQIHEAMGRFLGVKIWDPEVYAFDKIPDKMDPKTAVIVVTVAILSAVIGAVVPAIRAARLNPVDSLRFE